MCKGLSGGGFNNYYCALKKFGLSFICFDDYNGAICLVDYRVTFSTTSTSVVNYYLSVQRLQLCVLCS